MMRKFKKITSALLAVMMMLTTCMVILPTNAAEYSDKTTITWATHDTADGFYAASALSAASRSAGVRFVAANAFCEVLVGIHFGNGVNVAIYKWNTDYATTIAGTALFTKSLGDLGDTRRLTTVALDSTLPAGEYLVLATNTSGNFWAKAPNSAVEYYNGGVDATTLADANYRCMVGGISYVDNTTSAFGTLSVLKTETKAIWATHDTADGFYAASALTAASTSAAVRFVATNDFNAVHLGIHTGKGINVAVYEWKTDYAATIEGTALFTKSLGDMGDTRRLTTVALDSALPAGEYLVLVTNTSGNFWAKAPNSAVQYFNGGVDATTLADANYRCMVGGITYVGDVPATFGSLDNGSGTETDPPATETDPVEPPVEDKHTPAQWGQIGGGSAAFLCGGALPSGTQRNAAVRFNALNAFDAVLFGTDNTKNYTTQIYEWNTDYATTVAGTPVFEKTQAGVAGKNTVELDSALPAGEYLVVMSATEDWTNVWTFTPSTQVEYYYGGTATTSEHEAMSGGIVYVDDSVSGFGALDNGTETETNTPETDPPATETDPVEPPVEDKHTPAQWGQIGGGSAAFLCGGALPSGTQKNAAVRFNALNAFDAVLFGTDNTKNYTTQIYEWNTDYATTVAGTPVFEKTQAGVAGKNTVELGSALPAGEYLVVMSATEDWTNVWTFEPNSKVEYYYNGAMTTENYETMAGGIVYVDDSVSGFGSLDNGSGTETDPPATETEPVTPPDTDPDAPPLEVVNDPVLWAQIGGGAAAFMEQNGTQKPIAARFVAKDEFIAFVFGTDDKKNDYTTAIYAWNTDYATTIAQEPVFRKTQTGVAGMNTVAFSKALPAGDYLVVVTARGQWANVWTFDSNEQVQYFYCGNPVTANYETMAGGIVYADASVTELGFFPKDLVSTYWATPGNDLINEYLTDDSGAAVDYALQFNAVEKFEGFTLSLCGNGKVNLALYKWNKNYQTTLADDPVYTTVYANSGDGEKGIQIPAMDAGEYILVISNDASNTEKVGLLCVENPDANVSVEIYSDSGTTNVVCGGVKYSDGLKSFGELSYPVYDDESDTGETDTEPVDPPESDTTPVESDSETVENDTNADESNPAGSETEALGTSSGDKDDKGCKSSVFAGISLLMLGLSSVLLLKKKEY